jgi:hypothetical protein
MPGKTCFLGWGITCLDAVDVPHLPQVSADFEIDNCKIVDDCYENAKRM